MKAQTLKIGGMSCGHCVMSVRNALSSTPGVKVEEVRIGSAKVVIDETTAPAESAADAVRDAGYDVLETTEG